MALFPLTSVIISSYKQMQYLYQSIDSVLQQDYPNIELVITDDGTDEFDVDEVRAYVIRNNRGNISKEIVIKNEVNIGTVKNYNGALAVATGKYVMLLDGDDLQAPNCISPAVSFMEINSEYYVAAGHSFWFFSGEDIQPHVTQKDATLREKLAMEPDALYLHMCKYGQVASLCAHIFKREFFLKEGYFDERYILSQDVHMIYRISRQGYRIGYLDFYVHYYRKSVGISTGGSVQFWKDYQTLAKLEYWPNVDILGKRYCIRYQRWIDCFCESRNNFAKWSWTRRILFGIRHIDVIVFRIIPDNGGIPFVLRQFRRLIRRMCV